MGKYLSKRSRNITPDEVNRWLIWLDNSAKPERNKAMLALLYITGCRVSELIDLKRLDFDVSEDYVKINILSQKQRNSSPIIDRRTLTIGRRTVLLEHVLKWISRFDNDQECKIFNLSRQRVHQILSKKLEYGLCPHMFRHNRMQKLADRGLSANQLQAFAGWSGVGSSDAYVKKSSALAEAAKDKID